MASTLADSSEELAGSVIDSANIQSDRAGSDRYQQTHMGEIFADGLSFSGFERNKVFFGTAAGQFEDLSSVSGADHSADSRGVCISDFDDDGDPDVFVNAIQRENHLLFRNDLDGGNRFVKIRLTGVQAHADAIGAIVKVTTAAGIKQAQILSCGSGFESQHSLELIFGLGDSPHAEVSVLWPGGTLESFGQLQAGSRSRLLQGSGKASSYAARTFKFPPVLPRGLRFDRGFDMTALEFEDFKGQKTKLPIGKKPLLLNFWQTTCRGCLEELPLLQAIQAAGKVEVITLSLDTIQHANKVEALWQKNKLNLKSLRVPEALVKQLFDLNRLEIPLSVIIGNDGRVERIISGKVKAETLSN